MGRIVHCISVCLFVLAAAPAFAQQRLFVRMYSEIVELDSRQLSLGAVIRRFPVPGGEGLPDNNSAPVVLGGGRFLAWSGRSVILLDTLSGAVQRFTFPGFSAIRVIDSDGNGRLVVLGEDELRQPRLLVADARSGHVHFLNLAPGSMRAPFAYAAASDLLFVAKPRTTTLFPGTDFHDVDVIHAGTGTLLKTLDISPAYAGNPSSTKTLSANAAGTRLLVTDLQTGTLFAFDVASGVPFANAASLPYGRPIVDELRNRVIVAAPFADGIAAFAADSLRFLGQVSVRELPLPPGGALRSPRKVDVSGLSATVFVLEAVSQGFFACTSRLIALDADTGQVRRTVDLGEALGSDGCRVDLLRVTEPAAPTALAAEVVGRQVVVTWQRSFGATQYEIEVGSAPGFADVATISAPDPLLVVNDVPSGAYYVRVRGINTIGKGGASEEIYVIVP